MPNPGSRNSITDVAGVSAGHATDERIATGVTVLRFDNAVRAAVDVRGGGPGTRETAVLAPENLVQKIDALVLSGGSVFGLAAADGVAAVLSNEAVGLKLSKNGISIPIVPAAVLHDLENCGDKDWQEAPPYRELGKAALAAAGPDVELGSVGAGHGARAGTEKGGVGSASIDLADGIVVAALAAVNSLGTVRTADGERFWAWPYEQDAEFGGKSPPQERESSDPFPAMSRLGEKGRMRPGANTTLAVVATSLDVTRSELLRIAMMAHDGMARAIRPAHTLFDGDIVFAVSSAEVPEPQSGADRAVQVSRIGSAAVDTLARAIARGVYSANPENT